MNTRPMIMLGLAGIALLGVACGEDTTGPGGGSGDGARLQVRVEATGQDIDNTVTIALDDGDPTPSSGGGTVPYTNVEFGQHVVTIDGVSKNCVVAGGEVQTIQVTEPNVTFTFNMTCTPLEPDGGGGGGGGAT
jgi:hypothetical protein